MRLLFVLLFFSSACYSQVLSVVKFDSEDPDAFIIERPLRDDGVVVVDGYFVPQPFGAELAVADGDYIVISTNGATTYTIHYAASVTGDTRKYIDELIAAQLRREIRQAITDMGLSVANRITLYQYISSVNLLLIDGEISLARAVANNLATTAVYTQGRKDALLGMIDEAIDKL